MQDGMRMIVQELRTDPYALETAYISVIAFAGKAKSVTPLTELYKFYPPTFPIGGGTSLGAALNFLMDDMDKSLVKTTLEKKGDWKPIIFLFTDGTPTDDPTPAFTRWNQKYRHSANIVAISIGDNANTQLLGQISDNVLRLNNTDEMSFKSFFKWVTASIKATSVSVTDMGDDEVKLAPTSGINLEKVDTSKPCIIDENFVVLVGKCSNTKKTYLVKYAKRMAEYKDVDYGNLGLLKNEFKLVGAYPIDEETYNSLSDGNSNQSINTTALRGVPTCPCCGGPAKRETDTMPQWAGSSWYFLRYTDPHNDEALASPEALKYWMPVDWYNGGMEHTTLHLLYSRFWHKFLYDEGVVPCPEPYQKRTSHGMILGENGEKMSKSRGNVVNPDDIVREYGADTLRTYEMFIGAFDLSASWSEDGVKGCRRFLERVWKLQDLMTDEEGYSADMETKMHQTIKKVSSDFENLKYNTAIAAMMALINDFYKKNAITRGEFKTLITLLNPVAPHITEELWQIAGFEGKVYQTAWPEFDEAKTVESSVEIAVQINGKTKGTLSIGKDDAKEDVIAKAKEAIADKLTGNIVKEIYVPGRIVNIVMR